MKLFTQDNKGGDISSPSLFIRLGRDKLLLSLYLMACMFLLPKFMAAQATTSVNITTSTYCTQSSGDNIPITVPDVRYAASGATITIWFDGDFGASTEWFDLYGEGNTNMGKAGPFATGGDCSGWESVTFTVSQSDMQAWTLDGKLEFLADATSAVSQNICTPGNCTYLEISYTGYKVDNDAAVIDVLPQKVCAGSNTISAIVGNKGDNQITSLKINWSVDGALQTAVTHTGTLDSLSGSGTKTATVALGSVTFGNTAKEIKVWVSDPNSTTDANHANDTLEVTIRPGLSGSYTIGGSGADYSTFVAAVDDLNTYGLCGPAEFTVSAGTYDRLELGEIPGASSTNTVTFTGANKATTIISHNGTSTTNWQTILLDGTDYVTFKNFTVKGTGSYGVGIFLTNSADHNTFENIDVEVRTTTSSSNVNGIIGSGASNDYDLDGATGSYNTFNKINVTGGYAGVRFTGDNYTNSTMEKENSFTNITVDNYYYYGIYIKHNDEPVINYNHISGGRYTYAYGIYNYRSSGSEAIGNYIDVNGYGMYHYYANYYTYNNKRAKVVNNMIIADRRYGIYGYRGEYTDYYHNTILCKTDYEALYLYGATAADILNNIFVTYSTGDYAFYTSGSSSFINIDYNIYYAPNYDLAYIQGATYNTLADWQSADPQYNEHSYDMDPGFISNSNAHLNNSGVKPYGVDLGLTVDVDGDPRCDFAPTIGADESLLGKTGTAIAQIFAPDSVFINSPVLFEGRYVQGSLQRNRWYIDDVLMKDSIDFNTVFTSTGTYEVKVVSRSCSNVDADSIDITVYNPTTAPVADFIASANEIGEGEVVSLTNLSEHGPTSFQWEISPDVTFIDGNPVPTFKYVGGSNTSAYPDIQFLFAGEYEACLTATNSLGSDTVCRTAYIEVLPKVNLGSQNIIRSARGFLYDDGGPEGEYSDGGSGTKITGVLIDACASEVFLRFDEFNLECGYDYVRVYDGSSNQGTPLFTCTNNIGPGGDGPGFTGPGCNEECIAIGDTLVATSGTMYIEMSSDPAVTAPGFEAFWWSTPANVPQPVAAIAGPDSVCRNNIVTFLNESTGDFNTYKWDFDGDFSVFESEDSVSAEWAFVLTGQTTVTLIVENCGGRDTLIKTITVYDPVVPAVTFEANNLRPTPTDIVTFTPTLSECVDKYRWTFTYANGTGTFAFENGTNTASVSPMVTFADTGCWNVELWAENVTGMDSLIKTCYIRVKENYCTPTVGTVVSDIGIASVKFNTIDNTSAQGAVSYSNFVNTHSTTIEIGVTYDLEVSRTTNINNITYAAWLDWNQDGDFDDFGEELGRLTNSSSKTWTQSVTVPIIVKEGPTVMRVGVSRASGANTPCGQNSFGEFEDYRVIVSQDQTPPVITLFGSADTMVEQGRTYVDPGFIAMDNLAGNLTPDVTADTVLVDTEQIVLSLNTFVVRDYEIRYRVEDYSGNVGTATRIVRVFSDTTAPELTIAPGAQLSVDVAAGTYSTPAVTLAEDNIDGNFTANVLVVTAFDNTMTDTVQVIDPVDPAVVDTYTVTYYAVDANGNETTVTRTVVIYDDVPPTLTLLGDNPVEHQIGEQYIDAGVDPDDNYYSDAELMPLVTANTDLNINEFGTYSYTYTLTDPSGNGPISVTRTIIITDTIEPMIMIIGNESVVADVNEPFLDQGVQVNDNYGLKGTWTAGGSFYANFPDGIPTHVGVYTITYSVEDLAGNVVTVDRTVNVVDRIAPEVSLVGGTSINICRFTDYTDSGYVATDNYDEAGELDVQAEGSWYTEYIPTGLPGTYSIRYIVTDSSGNVALSTVRTINVLHESDIRCIGNGIAEAELEKNITVYPNPNSGMFTIKANLPEMKQVRMSILNVMGQEVAVVAEGMLQSDVYSVDLSNQASGVYFLQVNTENHSFTKQVVIAR